MAVNKSAVSFQTANSERIAMAASAASTSTTTPDYHLPWTGAVVEETLRKMMNFNPNEVGGIVVLESSSDAPANIDSVVEPNNYTAKYMTATNWISDLTGASPVNLSVFTQDGIVYQLVESMGNKWIRFSTDNGANWSDWIVKATNSGDINTEDPEEEQKDQITIINENLTQINNTLAASITVGPTDIGEAMLNGTFDYDTNAIVPAEP